MPQEIGPDAERRIVLKHFAITEEEIERLAKLAVRDPREVEWHIDTEYRAQLLWLERRRTFLRLEVFGPPIRPPTDDGTGHVVRQRPKLDGTVRGTKLG